MKEPFTANSILILYLINFVNSEFSGMVKEEIIRPSRSPYNSSVLVEPKRGFNEDGTPKLRLVIDYKKSDGNNIPDRYPIQDPLVIVTNIGKIKYFSTIELESGTGLQILENETDIQKTSFPINN